MLKTTKQPFNLNEATDFESLGGGRVRFTVFCIPASQDVYRMGLYELCVEADADGVYDVDPLHGFDEDDHPIGLTLGESSDLERWALFSESVRKVSASYFDARADEVAYANA